MDGGLLVKSISEQNLNLNFELCSNLSMGIDKNYTINKKDIFLKNASELNMLENYLKIIFENQRAGTFTIIIYLIIIIFGIFANSCIIFGILKMGNRSIGREKFIFLNLAIVDLLFVSFIVPIELYWKVQYVWEEWTILCKIFHFFKNYFLYVFFIH